MNESVQDFDDLEEPIEVWDRGYTDYDRFCEKKRAGDNFVMTLKQSARTTVVACFEEFSVTDDDGTRQVTDDVIELGETDECFRRVTLDDLDNEVIE